MKYIDFEEIKHLELQILRKYIDFCNEHQLKYILYAGTLLGAVRHGGFIPWDDDIDVAMPRPDYNRFLKLVHKYQIAQNLKLYNCYDKASSYWVPIAKLVDERTAGNEIFQGKGVHNGVWIDIFPIDGISSNYQEQKTFFRKINWEKRMLKLETLPFRFSKNPLKLIKRILVYPIYLLGKDKNHKIRAIRINELIQTYSYKDSTLVSVNNDDTSQPHIIEKSVIENTMKTKFEDIEALIPVDYDSYLKVLYGDYMTLPPAHLRVPVHEFDCWWKEDAITSKE